MTDPANRGDQPELDGVGITPQPEKANELPPLSDDPSPVYEADLKNLPTVITRRDFPAAEYDAGIARLFIRAYTLVAIALGVSGIVAATFPIEGQPGVEGQLSTTLVFFFEVAMISATARYVPLLPRFFDAVLLAFVAILNGLTFSALLFWIPRPAIAYGFFVTSLAFAATAFFCRATRRDPSGPAGIVFLFVAGLGLTALPSLFIDQPMEYKASAYSGFMVVAGLLCFLMDYIRDLELEFEDDPSGWKAALCGALVLYLNVLNARIVILRIVASIVPTREERMEEARRHLRM